MTIVTVYDPLLSTRNMNQLNCGNMSKTDDADRIQVRYLQWAGLE